MEVSGTRAPLSVGVNSNAAGVPEFPLPEIALTILKLKGGVCFGLYDLKLVKCSSVGDWNLVWLLKMEEAEAIAVVVIEGRRFGK